MTSMGSEVKVTQYGFQDEVMTEDLLQAIGLKLALAKPSCKVIYCDDNNAMEDQAAAIAASG